MRLLSVSSGVTTAYFTESVPKHASYVGHLDFRFRVLDYLKGTGPNEITAVVVVSGSIEDKLFAPTRQEMADALPGLLADRDTRWDDREAVVFLRNNHTDGSHAVLPYVRQAGRYYMGEYSLNYPGDDAYTVSSRWIKAWLPEASPSGDGAVDSDQQEFLTDAPPGTSTSTPATSSITLAALNSKITEVSSWAAENGGSDDQLRCIKSSYTSERSESVTEGFDPYKNYRIQTSPIQSGLAAGTEAWSDQDGTAYKTLALEALA